MQLNHRKQYFGIFFTLNLSKGIKDPFQIKIIGRCDKASKSGFNEKDKITVFSVQKNKPFNAEKKQDKSLRQMVIDHLFLDETISRSHQTVDFPLKKNIDIIYKEAKVFVAIILIWNIIT